MENYVIDSTNVSTAVQQLTKGGKYFVITVDVVFPLGIFTIGPNSVLAFRGGSFTAVSLSIVDLTSCVIDAGAYPIFNPNVTIQHLKSPEVKAEWFKSRSDASDDVYINRAIISANGCPVVLEAKTYNLKNSIKFANSSARQTLICPGTLSVASAAGSIPAIDINAQTVTLKINKIVGAEKNVDDESSDIYKGIGIRFSRYNEYSDIEVNTMRKLNRGFSVDPNMEYIVEEKITQYGGIQYCRVKFGSIQADYCCYVDVYGGAVIMNAENDAPIIAVSDVNENTTFGSLKVKLSNWFSESQISGELMEGQYGIYIVDISEKIENETLQKRFINVMNGLKFENISFERITGLALRIRSVMRSVFLNQQMFNSMPGTDPVGVNDFTPWIDLDNTREVRMTFNSFVLPNHIQVGNGCKNIYINGAILDDPANYASHFDTLGIGVLYENGSSNQKVLKSQMFVTNSVTPFNMTKQVITGTDKVTTKYLSDLLPNLIDGTENKIEPKTEDGNEPEDNRINLPVLPNSLYVSVGNDKTLVLDLSGLKDFAPCLNTIYASISPKINNINGGKLQFQTSDNVKIEGGAYEITGICKKIVTASGWYSIQWLSNWTIRITKI